MTDRKHKIIGFVSLVGTTFLWGTSFAFIKLSVRDIDPSVYTFTRTALATLILLPIALLKYRAGTIDRKGIKYGFITGIAYSTGLYLQSAGTYFVDPSISAFITGLSTIHVHFYSAMIKRKYSLLDLIALTKAILGLYYLTGPRGGFEIGELLVFIATIAWAVQIVLISVHGGHSLLEFLFGMFLAGILIGPLAISSYSGMSIEVFLYLVYLAIACSIGATALQVLGQRYISAHTAALIFLLEPIFAFLFSLLLSLEQVDDFKLIGGGLIVLSLFIAGESELRRE